MRESWGETLWRPNAEEVGESRLTAYAAWLAVETGRSFPTYQKLWDWSVTELEEFWASIVDYFDVPFGSLPRAVLDRREMPASPFFPGATLNYADQALRFRGARDAIVFWDENGGRTTLSFDQLRAQVAGARIGLQRLGVRPGDRVVGLLGNRPEAVVSMLAAASLGAIWSCCPTEFGVESVLDRFGQIEPTVLIANPCYSYNGKTYDKTASLVRVAEALPTLRAIVWVDGPAADAPTRARSLSFDELLADDQPLEFESLPFDHPLFILYSSGSTGPPKAIVHGHGGILLEHLKQLALHHDIRPHDRFFWHTTTGWMMWNYLVSGLALGATIVLYDGSPGFPDLEALFGLAEREQLTQFGTSAPFLLACRKAGLEPRRKFSFDSLRSIGSTGAPLPPEGFEWVYEAVKKDVWLASVSGGTDVCTAFVSGCPWLPVRSGELQCFSLGARVEAFDPDGCSLKNELGELVLTEPMPSMPVSFWNDATGDRYRASYFERFPGVWHHGDWIRIDEDGRSVIYGRSDSTLNRDGVRIGTSEFYRALEDLPGLNDSLVVETGAVGERGRLWLFVVLEEGAALDRELRQEINGALRGRFSPRHVPDELLAVPEIPLTRSGKKLEIPIKKILDGALPSEVAKPGALKNPEALTALIAIARDGARS